MNPETRSSTSNASRYSNNVLYDVLPFEDDTDIMNHDNRASRSRDSQWAGWLKDLDSIKVKQFSAYDTDSPADGSTLVDGRDVTIWVGPYQRNAATGAIELADEKDLLWLFGHGEQIIYGPTYPSQDDLNNNNFTLDQLQDFTKEEDDRFQTFEDVRLASTRPSTHLQDDQDRRRDEGVLQAHQALRAEGLPGGLPRGGRRAHPGPARHLAQPEAKMYVPTRATCAWCTT